MPSFDKEELNDIPILDVAQRLGIHVKKDKKSLCFLHEEKTPSLQFYTKNNTWFCFGCSKGISVIDLVMKFKRISYIPACQWLADAFQKHSYQSFHKKKQQHKTLHLTRIQKEKYETPNAGCNADIYDWVLRNTTLSVEGKKYLENERKLNPNTIEYFQLRDLPTPREFFIRAIEYFGEGRLQAAGLIKIKEGRSQFIWWDHTLIIPSFDELNNVVYLQGRNLKVTHPKYVNLAELSPAIFNIGAIKLLKQGEILYICEGALDTMMVHEKCPNVIGMPSATNIKDELIHKLISFDLHLIPDHDSAGENMFKKLSEKLRLFGKTLKKFEYDFSYKDISEYLKATKL